MEISVKSSDYKSTEFMIANFTNGQLKADASDKAKFNCFDESKNVPIDRKRKILVGEVNGMTYTGQNTNWASKGLCKYMVGVRKKSTGKLQLYDAQMFSMKPQCLEDKGKQEDETPEQSFREKNDALTAAFGSNKKKRAMNSRIKNKLKEEVLEEAVGTVAEEAIQRTGVNQLLAPTENQVAASEIPPFDINATRPQDVYKLCDIISEVDMESMKGPAQVFASCTRETINEWAVEQSYPSYILQMLRFLPVDETARLRKSCILMYLNYMMKLYHLSGNVQQIEKSEDIPTSVKKKLLDLFTLKPEGSSKRVKPKRLQDRLTSYILVLCLILEEFSICYTLLQKDLLIPEKRMFMWWRALGCKIKKNPHDKTTIVVLTVPLTFPENKMGKAKSKT